MRRISALIIVLLHFFVQLYPLCHAEEIVIDPLPIVEEVIEDDEGVDAASSEHESDVVTGATLDVPSVGSGGIVPTLYVDSGATMASTGTILLSDIAMPAVDPPSDVPASSDLPVRVVVSEVMWMGSDRSTADEWVEVAAFGSGAMTHSRTLSGWTIVAVKSGVETVLARFRSSHVVSSGSVLLVANTTAEFSRLSVEPSLVTTGISLANSQLLLRLKDASGAIVDEVDDGIGVPMAGSNLSGGAKASMERIDPWQPGNVAANWKSATSTIGFDDGPPIFGTPGLVSWSPIPSSPASSSVSSSFSSSSAPVDVSPLPALRLTEIMANPAGIDTDEWIEIASFDTAPVDLDGATLRIGTLRFELSGLLAPGEHRRFGKVVTGLPLPNPGGTVELLLRDRVIDAWTYIETAEGISLGRTIDGVIMPQCVPSPDTLNISAPIDPRIIVQSSSASTAKLTLNLEARAAQGVLTGATCSWLYPDGYVSASCNPPSHSMAGPILGDIIVVVQDYCGNTVTRTLHVDIAGPIDDDRERFGPVCLPTAFTGVVISEVFSNPPGDEAEGEWIEIFNSSTIDKALCGWSIDDGERGSEPYPLDRWRLPPGERLMLHRSETNIVLGNDTDAVRLFAPLPAGGSAAHAIVRYLNAPEGRSWSRRDDGVWLWSDPTPDTSNAFTPVRWPSEIVATISAAMPNPAGSDATGDEWVEVKNSTKLPLVLTGWKILIGSKSYPLDGIILGPNEGKRIPMKDLTNTNGLVRLYDREDLLQSTIAWKSVKDDEGISQSRPVANESGLTLVSSDDCIRWVALDAEERTKNVLIDGISAEDKILCTNYVLALSKNKKVEQKIYSFYHDYSSVFLDGTDMASILLREGLALSRLHDESPFSSIYEWHEAEARSQRRGIWAAEENAKIIDSIRFEQAQRDVLVQEGLVIRPSFQSGIVQSGEVLTIETNVPAQIFVAQGTGALLEYNSPIVLAGDTELRIEALSRVSNFSGNLVHAISFQSYHMLKSKYQRVLISEVYPSPAKGEREWVELYNPTAESAPLLGWLLDDQKDAGSAPYPFSASDVLGPYERRIFSGTTVAWNNTGDAVRLIDPRGRISHTIEYGSIKMGHAVAVTIGSGRDPISLCTTVRPTPGTENRCIDAPPKPVKKSTKTFAFRSIRHPVRYVHDFSDDVDGRFFRDRFSMLLRADVQSASVPIFMPIMAAVVLISSFFSIQCCLRARKMIEKKP